MSEHQYAVLWQRLKAHLSGEMHTCTQYMQLHENVSADLLLKLHSKMHALAQTKGEMERMEAEWTEGEHDQ